MKKIIIGSVVLSALSLLMIPIFANAQLGSAGTYLQDVGKSTGLASGSTGNLPAMIGTVIKVALSLVGTLFLAFTIYAGILWMTAAGEEDRINKAKNIITACVVGLIIVMSAYAITYFVTTKLGGNTPNSAPGGFGGGCCQPGQTTGCVYC